MVVSQAAFQIAPAREKPLVLELQRIGSAVAEGAVMGHCFEIRRRQALPAPAVMVAQVGLLPVALIADFSKKLAVAVPGILPGEGFSVVFKIEILLGIILQIAGLQVQAGATQGDASSRFSPGAMKGAAPGAQAGITPLLQGAGAKGDHPGKGISSKHCAIALAHDLDPLDLFQGDLAEIDLAGLGIVQTLPIEEHQHLAGAAAVDADLRPAVASAG